MTEEELARLEELASKATPGPWEWVAGSDALHATTVPHEWHEDETAKIIVTDSHVYPPHGADAAFIAAAREAVPALLAEVRRLRAEKAEREARDADDRYEWRTRDE